MPEQNACQYAGGYFISDICHSDMGQIRLDLLLFTTNRYSPLWEWQISDKYLGHYRKTVAMEWPIKHNWDDQLYDNQLHAQSMYISMA